MIEKLFTFILFYISDFADKTLYSTTLHEMFKANSNDSKLLELEDCLENDKDTFAKLFEYCEKNEDNNFNYDLFSNILFSNLKEIYESNKLDTVTFVEKSYTLHGLLPENIKFKEPFKQLFEINEFTFYVSELSKPNTNTANKMLTELFAKF